MQNIFITSIRRRFARLFRDLSVLQRSCPPYPDKLSLVEPQVLLVAQVGLDPPASDLLVLRSEVGAAILMGPQVPR